MAVLYYRRGRGRGIDIFTGPSAFAPAPRCCCYSE